MPNLDAVSEILGKTIVGIVVSETYGSGPRSRLHMIFSDETSYEFWVNDGYLSFGGGIDRADLQAVLCQLKSHPKTQVKTIVAEPSQGIVQKGFWTDKQ